MTEKFLFYIWQFRLFNQQDLKTTSGEGLQIIKPGELNPHAGPDFKNSLIRLEKTTWAGNIEIHINASDWNLHQHSEDENYDNIILHVVFNNDRIILRKSGEPIPVLELKNRVDWNIWENYRQLLQSSQWIPCSGSFMQVDSVLIDAWLHRLAIARMERKSSEIENYSQLNRNDLSESFYFLLAKNFGFYVNSLPFEMLAKSLPLQVIGKHRSSLFQLEALLFGQAGMLEENIDDLYHCSLKKEYKFLQNKFRLQPIPGHLWKFLRLRPGNFPTIRIAQFAALLYHSQSLLSQIVDANSIDAIKSFFKIQPSSYWNSHYLFGRKSIERPKPLGNSAIQSILVNVVAPMLVHWTLQHLGNQLQEKALQLLEETEAEDNSIIRGFKEIGFKATNSLQSQGLIQLKQNYCEKRKCLECGIGIHLLRV